MALNIDGALEILKRAGFDSHDKMNAGKTERHMVEGLRSEEEDPSRDIHSDYLDEVRERIEHHRNPQNMSAEDLLSIDDL